MSDGNFFTELAETRRKIWAESDGTLEGYAALCARIAREAIAADAAEQAETNGQGPAVSRRPRRARKNSHGAMLVCEGVAPGYGEENDLARKGAKGE